jgi:hypothetical protein
MVIMSPDREKGDHVALNTWRVFRWESRSAPAELQVESLLFLSERFKHSPESLDK